MPRKTKVAEPILKEEKKINLKPVERSLLKVELVGMGELILNKKSRSYELDSAWANQNKNVKGAVRPPELMQPYNSWEKLITSVHWRDPIIYHDEDWSKYTKEEWEGYMNNNAPCVCMEAIRGSIHEAFKTFHYHERTDGLDWTDFERTISFTQNKFPITFASVKFEQDLVNLKRSGCALAEHNVFSGWSCKVSLVFVDSVIPVNTILDILNTAGICVGIHTQRKNGYGRFQIGDSEVVRIE